MRLVLHNLGPQRVPELQAALDENIANGKATLERWTRLCESMDHQRNLLDEHIVATVRIALQVKELIEADVNAADYWKQ